MRPPQDVLCPKVDPDCPMNGDHFLCRTPDEIERDQEDGRAAEQAWQEAHEFDDDTGPTLSLTQWLGSGSHS